MGSRFSAGRSYYFATELQKRLGVTVGIIGSYRGATWNENWMTPESIKNEPELKYLFEDYEKGYSQFKDEAAYEDAYQKYLVALKEWQDKGGWSHGMVPFAPVGPKAYQRPSGLDECMIKPLQPFAIKGCIWYQGEGNSARYKEFRTLFHAISAEVYGQNHVPYGPTFKSVDFQEGKAKISFDHAGGGLVLRPDDSGSFEVAGADKVFSKAGVEVKGDRLLLWNTEIKDPKYIRYAFSPSPKMVLFNREGLPASPFTTEK